MALENPGRRRRARAPAGTRRRLASARRNGHTRAGARAIDSESGRRAPVGKNAGSGRPKARRETPSSVAPAPPKWSVSAMATRRAASQVFVEKLTNAQPQRQKRLLRSRHTARDGVLYRESRVQLGLDAQREWPTICGSGRSPWARDHSLPQTAAILDHVQSKGISTTYTHWCPPTMVVTHLDRNEIFFWLSDAERAKWQRAHASAP